MALNLQERTALILKEQGIKQKDLVELTGATKGLVGQWVNGPAKTMSYTHAKPINAKYGYSIDWLTKGEGAKFATRKRLESNDVSPGPDIEARSPLISWVMASKFFAEPVDNYRVGEAEDWLPRPKRAGPHTYCLRVEGDSMTAPYGKSYPSGCIIFVDPDKRAPVSGQRIIAKLKGAPDVTFKVFVQEAGKTFLKPLNPQYPAIHEPFKVIGTVIGKWEDE